MPRDDITDMRPRSRSPHRSERPYKRSRRDSRSPAINRSVALPFSAQSLSKHDLTRLRPLLTLYLDVQKRLDIDEIDEAEVKGRWKSFVKKWNSGDLAEGWYDPKTLEKALSAEQPNPPTREKSRQRSDDETGSDDEYGPALPGQQVLHYGIGGGTSRGAAAPSLDELRARREEAHEATQLDREQRQEELRGERRLDRRAQKERLDELVPKADAGTRERQLEKKRDLAASNKSFANAAHEAGDTDLRDSDVMGEDGLSEFKRMKQHEERKKNERELRREEVLRARRAEREEKVKGLREKEEKTMAYLKEIAKQRFG